MSSTKTLIKNIGKLVLASESPIPFKKGKALSQLPCIESAFLIIEGGKFASFGTDDETPEFHGEIIDANKGIVLPGFIDCHTHLVFAESRELEFIDRIHGLSYQEITSRGGGILNSAKKINETPEDTLYLHAQARLAELIQLGTGAIEIKSGYGLSVEGELKILRVIKN